MINEEKIQEAEKFAKDYSDKITYTQLRKFLSALNKLENKAESGDEVVNEAKYLKVKLAYQAGRFSAIKPLYNELVGRIDSIHSTAEFLDFARYVEAIVAYFKFYNKIN